MEKRLLVAIVLSFLVLFLYQALFVKKLPPPEPSPEMVTEVEKQPPQSPLKEMPPAQESQEPAEKEEFLPVSGEAEEQIIVNTSLYRAVWSSRGGVLKSWRLKEHTDDEGEDLELVSHSSQELNTYPFFLTTDDPDFDRRINNTLYRSSSYTLNLLNGQSESLRFDFADDKGTRVEKIFTFRDGHYDFDIQVNVWKNGQKIESRVQWGPGLGNPTLVEQRKRFGGGRGIAVYQGESVTHHDEKKYKLEESVYNFVQWAGYEDQYFTALFLTSPERTRAMFLKEDVEQKSYFYLTVNEPQIVYIGPKQHDTLKEFGYNTVRIIKYGFFGMIAEILYRAIKAIHNGVPNWGFSIIILTIIIKIIFFPLTYSSTKSMAKMQELQPKIKALKAKYKKAKQDIAQRRKMNEETMALYKEHGVNPAGGCLPMLVQLPIFWGFFRLLVVSIEFRHSPFIFWINDLSVKDPFYVTPILMGMTQFISQKMTPTSADPTQQRMMLIMPVIMTIFFMNFQSGLVLYWLTNNILQIGQQYIMNRFMHKKKRESHGKKRKK